MSPYFNITNFNFIFILGLHDILFSKISKKQRDPAMQLVAAVIEVSGRNSYLIHRIIDSILRI